jgi:hypothetical protein
MMINLIMSYPSEAAGFSISLLFFASRSLGRARSLRLFSVVSQG